MAEKYTCAQVIEALTKTKGMVYLAAKMLGCVHQTVYNYIRRHPTIAAARDAARGEFLDETELRLYNAVRRDEAWAIAFALKTIGKHRGYAERLETRHVDEEGKDVSPVVIYLPDNKREPVEGTGGGTDRSTDGSIDRSTNG